MMLLEAITVIDNKSVFSLLVNFVHGYIDTSRPCDDNWLPFVVVCVVISLFRLKASRRRLPRIEIKSIKIILASRHFLRKRTVFKLQLRICG